MAVRCAFVEPGGQRVRAELRRRHDVAEQSVRPFQDLQLVHAALRSVVVRAGVQVDELMDPIGCAGGRHA